MANLDTRSKRASSVQILTPWVQAPPLPDGTLGQGDRQHIAWTYSGILAAGAATRLPTAFRANPSRSAVDADARVRVKASRDDIEADTNERNS